MDYSPKCLKILGLETAWQLLYQLEEQGPSWLGSSHHIVPWLADGHLTLFKGLCSSFLRVCSIEQLRNALRMGKSFPGTSITYDSAVWEMWGTVIPGKGWMTAPVEDWEQVFGTIKHWHLDLWIVKWVRISRLTSLQGNEKNEKSFVYLWILSPTDIWCKQRKNNNVLYCLKVSITWLLTMGIKLSDTDAIKSQK